MLTARSGLTIALALLGGAAAAGAAAAEGSGLRAQVEEAAWPRWQARLVSNASFSLWRHAASEAVERQPFRSLSLLGDYYFARVALGPQASGGLRATSGLIIGSLSGQALSGFDADGHPGYRIAHPDASPALSFASRTDSAPYVGIGYTRITPKSGWGFSADIGLAARAGATGMARALGGESLDETLREMRLTPLLNVGVSYSF